MTELSDNDICTLRRLAWTSDMSIVLIARVMEIPAGVARSYIRGERGADVKCQYGFFVGGKDNVHLTPGDEADMMQWRVDGATYDEIAARMGIKEELVKIVLDNPSDDARKIFLRTNAYHFSDGMHLAHGELTVATVIEVLELRRRGVTVKRIAKKMGYSESLINKVSGGARGGHKYELAARYMERKYGPDWQKRR